VWSLTRRPCRDPASGRVQGWRESRLGGEGVGVLTQGGPAFDGLRDYFWEQFGLALQSLFDAAIASGEIHADVSAKDILSAIAQLSHAGADEDIAYSHRMVALLIDGLRYRSDALQSR
jgi:hypothetical protein